ncbi:allophanate hydrolase [Loigolactobacillus backii]|uniref:5-oxoprolinase subunit PxpB n=1 Tax=Loigolactobacillus backii TaxID=375175 RepID=UPI0007F0EDB8|nr:5-oxoprolinase subunit PxpB [Loigolactobacillus backii]ANK60422.1 allophanate hydrolase [Loigolactobacillus backii]ANK65301.1 allophanate hydrolase [Loigolactobacillus backii]ANK67862.1 allophanate hydrolase [Loigolactobacillus backii]OLF69482.1 allophanate hydrolase [Loigolactobacillus backii]PIO82562.1 allophanate hydrolase [Loigolactobacillus backii]
MLPYELIPASDQALNVTFPNRIDPQINLIISRLAAKLSKQAAITALLPAFRTLTVFYQPLETSLEQIEAVVTTSLQQLDLHKGSEARVVHIPVCYTTEFGPDLEKVAAHAKLDTAELIKRHTKPNYLIYMLGFLPGFAYLGGLDPQIAMPRLTSPRATIPAGSVGIAGEQTGMYPVVSPGGWQLIGRTPIKLFDPQRDQPLLYQAGDYIHFDEISQSEFTQITDNSAAYQIKVTREQVKS